MVYDGTASGFNDLVWVPKFGLPSVKKLICGTFPNSWMVYLDIGEFFEVYVGLGCSKIYGCRRDQSFSGRYFYESGFFFIGTGV